MVSKKENLGTEVAGNEAVETAETAENEVEETVEEGSAAVEDEESSTAIEDKEDSTYAEAEISEEAAESSEDDSEDDEEEKEEEEDPERLSELEILPGKTAYINFYYTIDPEIEGMKDQKVDFSFAYTLEDEEGKQTKNTLRETFRYAVDALNLMTVTAGGEKGFVETGKEDEMLLEFDLGLMREVLEEAIEEELEKTENGDASAAEAKRASASELLVGWEDENGERPLGKKDPAVIKNLKCEVETFGVKLDKFKAVPVKDDDNFGTSLKCSFYVSRKTLPGTYYGRVNASYKIKGKSFHTTQGFKVVVKQETGELELVGKIGDSEIVMTGPVSSFPKADELSLKVSEITQEQQEKVDEALQKKAEEEGTEINQYKALDIKLMADGVETEPEGDVQVRFKNVNLEKVDENKEAEQEKAEEQSIVKKAVRKVMSLFSARNEEEDVAAVAETGTEVEEESKNSDSVKVEGSEEAAGETGDTAENSENIKVLHLDEDAVVANEMKSEVQDNGDVVMDTDHFSIYIVVNVPSGEDEFLESIPVTVHHRALIDAWKFNDDGTANEVPAKVGGEITVTYESTNQNNGNTARDKDYSKSVLYPGSIGYDEEKNEPIYNGILRDDTTKDGNPALEGIKLYKSDETNLPNGSGTGIGYQIAINEWSKVSSGGHYKVSKVFVKNENYPEGKLFKEPLNEAPDNESASNIIKLAKTGNEITIYYEPLEDEFLGNVDFHDYNVTIESDTQNADLQHKGLGHNAQPIRSNRVGMNQLSLTNGNATRIGIGINNQSDSGIYHKYEGDSSKSGLIKGIPDSTLNQNNITFKSADPGLFLTHDIKTTETYYNKSTQKNETLENAYYAKKYVPDYQLGFLRRGDTYTLSKVYNEQNIAVSENLEYLSYTTAQSGTGWNWDGSKYSPAIPLYSNVFWPMDELDYGESVEMGKQRDHLFGKTVSKSEGGDYAHDRFGFSINDEKKGASAHNWFFGMRYDIGFSIGDYEGPMNYYFRGDDDFWLYIDGILVEDIDLGGIHAAKGAYVDLKDWMSKNADKLNKNDSHKMSVFFMERGGTGSCCFMSFTLPHATTMSTPGTANTSVTVRKDWQDEPINASRQPITVKLYQARSNTPDTKNLYATYTLNSENNWQYTWDKLPKYADAGSNDIEFIYTVEEVTVPGYQSVIRQSGLIYNITNIRSVKIPVKKVWEGGNERPEIEVQLYKKLVDIPDPSNIYPSSQNNETKSSNVAEGITELNKENGVNEEQEVDIGDNNENMKEATEELPDNSTQDSSSNEDEKKFVSPDPNKSWKPVKKEGDENYGKVTLNQANKWEHTWEMPLYEKDEQGKWKKVIYTVQELKGDWMIPEKSPEGWYEVKYVGDAMNGGVTITNTFKDGINGEISISKECVGNNETATFDFEIKEGSWNADTKTFTETTGSSLKGTNITVGDAQVTGGKIVVAYKIDDIKGEFTNTTSQIERWYKISEKSGNGNFIYDKTFYIVKMILEKQANGTYTARWDLSNVYKNGELYPLQGKEPQLPFKNYKVANLQITKVIGNGGSSNKDFEFTAIVRKGTDVINTVKFRLKADGKAHIIPVPVGSTVEITEEGSSHAGYSVSYQKVGDDSSLTHGDKFTIEIDKDIPISDDGSGPVVGVVCTNTPGAILPDTGGPGLLMMSRLGWMLLLLALLMAGMEIQFYGERRNRKTANVQREDTRGFDPNDY